MTPSTSPTLGGLGEVAPGAPGLLRGCAGCNGWIIADYPGPMNVRCRSCEGKRQPFAEWFAALAAGSMVYLQPYVAWRGRSSSQYVVRERDGDRLTVQLLGVAESLMSVHVCDVARDDVSRLPLRGAAA